MLDTLVAPEPWREALDEKLKGFAGGALQSAHIMAGTHPWAVDYLVQAPILALMVPRTTRLGRAEERAWLAWRFGSAVNRRPKLKHLMAEHRIAYPLRAIKAQHVNAYPEALIALNRMPLSELAQAIPRTLTGQRDWLRFVTTWKPYTEADRPDQFLWGVCAAGRAAQDGAEVAGDAGTLIDYLLRGRREINPRWTLGAALAAADRWHEELAAQSDAERFARHHGFGFDDPIDYGRLPLVTKVDGITFTALRSGRDLYTEGATMRHCVASYIDAVAKGRCWIYSATQDGARRATLELAPNGRKVRVAQLKGRCNSTPARDVRDAANRFGREINDALS